MSLGLVIYLLVISDNMLTLFSGPGIGCLIWIGVTLFTGGFIMTSIFGCSDATFDKIKMIFKRGLKIFVVLACMQLTILTFLPNSKQLAAIYLIPKIAENEQLQKIAGDGFEILKKKTESYLKELSEQVDKLKEQKNNKNL